MIFDVKFRNEKGEYNIIELSAPTKLDAWIIFMSKYSGRKWEIASVKRSKPKKVTVQSKKNFKKKITFNVLPPERIEIVR